MLTTRHLFAGLSLLGLVMSAGCCDKCKKNEKTERTTCNECTTSNAVAANENHHGRMHGRHERAEISGEPISNNNATVEREDARAGREAERTGGNAERVSDVDIKNLSRDGNIWVGGEPTDKGYRQIHERGVTAIVDLRNSTAAQQRSADEARHLGMDYINLPIDPNNMPTDKANAFLDFMRQHEGQQVLIHCGSANRASAMYAVYLGAVKGLSTDDAIQRARGTGLKEAALERDVRSFLSQRTTPSTPGEAVEPSEQ